MESARKSLVRLLQICVSDPLALAIPFLIGSIISSIAIFSFQFTNRLINRQRLRKEINSTSASLLSRAPASINEHQRKAVLHLENQPDSQDDLIREQLSRNYSFLGDDSMKAIRSSFVIVVGLGGVGSHAAHMLLRSGIEHIRVIDFDQVSLSSLNRHAVATQSDVGKSKVKVLAQKFKLICPHSRIDECNELFNLQSAEKLLCGNPDYVLDCIDNVSTKIELLKYCATHKIKVISSMGAGARADPSRIQIADISDTFEDPLARVTRRGLKKAGILSGITVVYSTEKVQMGLVPLEKEKIADASEYAALRDFRVRILPVLGTLPALFGCAMATHVITDLGHWKGVQPLATSMRRSTYVRVNNEIRDLLAADDKQFVPCLIPRNVVSMFSLTDIAFMIEETWRGRSIISKDMFKVTLVKWKKSGRIDFGNMVCMTKPEAIKHESLQDSNLESVYGKTLMEYVASRFEMELEWNKQRFS